MAARILEINISRNKTSKLLILLIVAEFILIFFVI